MGLETSLFIEIIDMHANTVLFSEKKQELAEKLNNAIQEGKEVFKLLEEYNFRLNFHVNVGNKHTAPTSLGCGCELCKRRHDYARLKLQLHRKIKGFEAFLCYGFYNDEMENRFIEEFDAEKQELLEKIELAKSRYNYLKKEFISAGVDFL